MVSPLPVLFIVVCICFTGTLLEEALRFLWEQVQSPPPDMFHLWFEIHFATGLYTLQVRSTRELLEIRNANLEPTLVANVRICSLSLML